MKENQVKKLWFVLSVFMFACLLVSGAHRLIAQNEPVKDEPASLRVVRAYLCCSPSAHAEAQKQTRDSRAQSVSRMHTAVRSVLAIQPSRMETSVDANGNVLRSQSYMRSVYQSFDLGDGFV